MEPWEYDSGDDVQSVEERTDYLDTGAKPGHAMYPI